MTGTSGDLFSITTFLDQPSKNFKSAFTAAIPKMQSAAQKTKIEEEIIISDEDVRFINEQPINDLVNSDQSDDENWNIEIPKSFRQKAFVHKTITKKQSKILTERCSNMLHKGKV